MIFIINHFQARVIDFFGPFMGPEICLDLDGGSKSYFLKKKKIGNHSKRKVVLVTQKPNRVNTFPMSGS